MDRYKEMIENAMSDLFQRNVLCDYLIENGKEQRILKDVYSLDAYLNTISFSEESNMDTKCFMYTMAHKAALPVFEVQNKKIILSGITLGSISFELSAELIATIYTSLANSRNRTNNVEYVISGAF